MSGKPYQPSPSPGTPFYNQEFSTQYTEYNIGLANQHLDKAGVSKKDKQGFRLDSNNNRITIVIDYSDFISGWKQALNRIADDWKKVGIMVNIRNYTRDILYKKKGDNLHDALVWLRGWLEVCYTGTSLVSALFP